MKDISPFKSFWMAGYECTDKLNVFGQRVDFLYVTGHINKLEEDYAHLKQFNIEVAREGIRWSQVEKKAYEYDWNVVNKLIKAGQKYGLQQIWDLCHFGFPDDLTPLHPQFVRRFVSLCKAFVNFYRSVVPYGPLIVTPVNEVSFLSWLGGEVRGTSPYCINMGWEVKYSLMRAYIEGVAAMKEIDAGIRILTTEPLVNMVPPLAAGEEQVAYALLQHEHQYQVLDILAGRICPELGGKEEYLDILGFNYYYNNQWIAGTSEFLPWVNVNGDSRWRSFGSLIKETFIRYNKPVVLTETSHPGEHRPDWITYIAGEAMLLLQQNIPFWGICLYPIIDRPDWDNLNLWHNSGLWDTDAMAKSDARVLYEPYALALLRVQRSIATIMENKLQHLRQAV